MTNDQFNSDQNDFDLSADSGDNLDMVADAPVKRKSRAPFLLFLLLIIGGAAFAAYKVFLGGDMSMDAMRPAMQTPPPVIAEAPAPVEPTPSVLPEGVTADASAQTSSSMNVQDMLAKSLEPVTPAASDTAAPTETVIADATTAAPTPTEPTATSTETTALPSPVEAPATTTEAAALPAPVAADVAKAEEVKPADAVIAEVKPDAVPATAVTEAMPSAVAPVVSADAAAKPTTTETVLEKAATPAAIAAMPAPAQDQLKPIDTAQTQKTADAVKEILGKDAIVSAEVQQAQTAAITEPTEVTPHAREVIFVKKAYNASSSQAVNAAGERILTAGQYNEAADMFDSQLKKNPSDPLALAGKAQALQLAGRTDEALRTYDRLLQLNPRDLEALTNSLGLVQMQNPQKALTKLQSLIQQYPDNAAVAGQLATTQARLMDTPNALRNFQKAMALDPTNPTYPFNMGVLFDRLGSVDKARAAYRQALDVAGAYPDKAGNINLTIIRERMSAMGG